MVKQARRRWYSPKPAHRLEAEPEHPAGHHSTFSKETSWAVFFKWWSNARMSCPEGATAAVQVAEYPNRKARMTRGICSYQLWQSCSWLSTEMEKPRSGLSSREAVRWPRSHRIRRKSAVNLQKEEGRGEIKQPFRLTSHCWEHLMDLQNDQIAEAGRDFWRPSTSPALLPGAGAAQAGWPGLRRDRCCAPPRMEISQPLWAAHSTVRPSFKNKNPIKQKSLIFLYV